MKHPLDADKDFAEMKTTTIHSAARALRRRAAVNTHQLKHRRKGVGRQPGKLKNILVPIDFSEPSKKALEYALSLAKDISCASVILLHVIELVPAYPDGAYPVMLGAGLAGSAAKTALRKFCHGPAASARLVLRTIVREGTPHHEITEAARESDADLIIIATNGRTGLAHVLLGSTTERVVRHAPCPVLVVREKEREFIRVRHKTPQANP